MNIRKAKDNDEDCLLVYNLSNDPIVRQNSFNTETIPYENHTIWYKKTIASDRVVFFLVFEHNEFVGQMRFAALENDDDGYIISLSISPNFRGKHIGLQFLKLGLSELKKDKSDIRYILAEVRVDNVASNKLFISAGFKIEKNNEEKVVYKFDMEE